MFKRISPVIVVLLIIGLVAPALMPATAAERTLITWWSHWANEPAKRLVIERIVADYEAANPDVDIVLVWWDKNPLRDAIRSTMTVGEGAPDITTFDSEVIEWVEAGWLIDLSDALPWENFVEGARLDGTYPDQGFPGNYKFSISTTVNMLFYNPDIFAELGIDVPENFQFTSAEFVDVVRRCSEAGFAGVADAIGNRPYPAVWPVQYALWSLVGPDTFNLYNTGNHSWDTPEARRALEYSVELRDAGLWPPSFSTMTIDEFHVYFHTQRQACMFYIPTWYTGRAFKPVAQGGQDPNWHFGMLRYPYMEGGAANDVVWASFESGYGVLSSTRHADVAMDILRFAAQPQYGALWTAVTNSPSAIRYNIETDWPSQELLQSMGIVPGEWDWYWEEYDRVYGPLPAAFGLFQRCGDFEAAVTSTLNEGLPLGLISVDEAIEMLDAALCNQ